jgi:hypothetical protein
MSKRIALKDLIEVDGVDISNYVRAVTFTSTDDRIDASGFNPTGASEFLSGQRVDEVALDIIMGRDASQPHQVLWPLHRDRSDFDFVWRADSSVAIGATNPELRGTVALPEYSEGATRGELEVQTLTFVGSDALDPLVFYET